MKIVRQISTGKMLYRSSPDFETGKGIINARFMFPDIPENDMVETDMTEQEINETQYKFNYANLRRASYPPYIDYLDAVVKGDTAQIEAYKKACLAVKAKYPKP